MAPRGKTPRRDDRRAGETPAQRETRRQQYVRTLTKDWKPEVRALFARELARMALGVPGLGEE